MNQGNFEEAETKAVVREMSVVKTILAALFLSSLVFGWIAYFVYQYWYIPRWAKLTGERLRREEAAGIPPSPRDYHYVIAFDDLGFTVSDLPKRERESWESRWTEVRRVMAYKRDFGTVDCICLFLFLSEDKGIELDERMVRWDSFTEALPRHLPGCKPSSDWWRAVAFPAFETNETELFSRE